MISPVNDRYSPSPSSNVLPRTFQETILSSFVPNPSLMQNHQNVPSVKHPRMASLNPMGNASIFPRIEQHEDAFSKSISPQNPHSNRSVGYSSTTIRSRLLSLDQWNTSAFCTHSSTSSFTIAFSNRLNPSRFRTGEFISPSTFY